MFFRRENTLLTYPLSKIILKTMAGLSSKSLCRNFTLEQIEEKITFYMDQLGAATVESYDKDTTQGRQKVVSASMEKIESILQAWLGAKECKAGVGGTQVVSQNFRNANRGAIV